MSMRDGFLKFGEPCIGKEECRQVVDTLQSGWLTRGPKVEKFEEMFKRYIGSRFACALNSGTSALHLSLIAAGIGPKDEVITTPLTFAATANVIVHVGARPVFVDIDESTLNIDPSMIEKQITKKTKAIIPVHFAGRPCDMKRIMSVARRHNLLVIEDAAHAAGAQYRGKRIGNIGDLTCFSFYANKNITTGEGGMVTTNKKEWADKIRVLSFHGINKCAWNRYAQKKPNSYEVTLAGYKYNMMDLQAAIGLEQIKKIEKFLKRREEIWDVYNEAFKDLPVSIPEATGHDMRHARQLYTLKIDVKEACIDRDEFRKALYNERIETLVHYMPLHLEPYYRKSFGYTRGDFPCAERVSGSIVSLPLSPYMSDTDVKRVVKAVVRILAC